MGKKLTTLDDWLREARRLRDAADASEREFLEFLRSFEQQRHLWQSSAATFDALIDSTLCGHARYRNWVAAQNDPEIAAATDTIGLHGAVAVVRITNPGKRSQAIEEMKRTVAHNGTVLSEQRARSIVARYAPERSTLPDPDAEKQELRDEITRLRTRISQLSTENAHLRAELREVRRSLTPRGRSKPSKPAANPARARP